MNRLVRSLLAFGVASAQVVAVAATANATTDIKDRIEALPGVRVVSEDVLGAARTFQLEIQQPADHRKPRGQQFTQRFWLVHKDEKKPVVLHTSGYGLSKVGLSEPARLVDGNQLSVEQRFFSPSSPAPADWGDLTIWQAASDHHRIVSAFKRIYGAKWLSTGASKGGMTSVYHRRFFPRDVDATIAYVAPNDVENDRDVYGEFVRNVGDDPTCNRRLEGVQRQLLQHRDELVARLKAKGYTYELWGGDAHKALEILVLDTPYTFWQYRAQEECVLVPGAGATVDQLWEFMEKTVGWDFYTDKGALPYVPYYYQAGTQLGWPEADETAVRDLLRHPGVSVPRSMVPAEMKMPRFDRHAMRDIDSWVRYQGSTLMFVNGENDPWSAEPFRLGRGTRDSFYYVVPKGNHGANITKLPDAQRAAATAVLQRWAGVSGAVSAAVENGPDPDSLAALRAHRG